MLRRRPGARFSSRFVRHYLEMVAAMLLGMVFVYPLWLAATGALESGWVLITEVQLVAMATAMAAPMVAWMWRRGHTRQQALEMSGAMYAGFVVLFPLLWVGLLSESAVTLAGHVLMLAFMLIAMLRHRAHYAGQVATEQTTHARRS